jgi:hypothetical protein
MKFITIFFIFCFVQINLYTLYCKKKKISIRMSLITKFFIQTKKKNQIIKDTIYFIYMRI